MDKQYDLIVFIGRLRPLHNIHKATIDLGYTLANSVAVLVGSNNRPRSPKNPFTFAEVEAMLYATFNEEKLYVEGIPDTLYHDHIWVEKVNNAVENALADFGLPRDAKVGLIGKFKDRSSDYLAMFPNYALIETETMIQAELSATDVRKLLFEDYNDEDAWIKMAGMVPDTVLDFLSNFTHNEHFERLSKWHLAIQREIAKMQLYPYSTKKGINTLTTDAIVYHPSGRVLLIRRKGDIGKGLLALPGGYLDVEEHIEEGCLRELVREETGINLTPPKMIPVDPTEEQIEVMFQLTEANLRRCLKKVEFFGHPERSQVGRIVTFAHLFILDTPYLPPTKAGDDAAETLWVKVADIEALTPEMFDDHADIIQAMMRYVR